MSLNEIKKELQIAGKGHNVLYEIVNSLKHTRTATAVIRTHVPGNRGTCFCVSQHLHGAGDTTVEL
jgi:hypothetical protein